MAGNAGRSNVDIKLKKSIGNMPYTNNVGIVGVMETNSNDKLLISPIPQIQSLSATPSLLSSSFSVYSYFSKSFRGSIKYKYFYFFLCICKVK